MKQAGDTMKYIASPNLVLEALCIWVRRANSYDQAYLESRLTSKGVSGPLRFRQRYAPFAALRQQLDAQVHVPEAHLKGLFVDLVSIAQNTGGPTPLPCCFLHLLPASAAATWSSFLPAWPGGRRRRLPGYSRLIWPFPFAAAYSGRLRGAPAGKPVHLVLNHPEAGAL